MAATIKGETHAEQGEHPHDRALRHSRSTLPLFQGQA